MVHSWRGGVETLHRERGREGWREGESAAGGLSVPSPPPSPPRARGVRRPRRGARSGGRQSRAHEAPRHTSDRMRAGGWWFLFTSNRPRSGGRQSVYREAEGDSQFTAKRRATVSLPRSGGRQSAPTSLGVRGGPRPKIAPGERAGPAPSVRMAPSVGPVRAGRGDDRNRRAGHARVLSPPPPRPHSSPLRELGGAPRSLPSLPAPRPAPSLHRSSASSALPLHAP